MSGLADYILHLHGWAALAVVFALPALESSAFVGFVFPGEIAVLLGGVLASQHQVSLPAVLVAAIAGAVIGDTIGYEVGRHFGRRLLEGTVGRFVRQHHQERAETYLRERGGKAVFLGRFTAALRVLIPGLAGMSGMPYRTFAINNAAGGAIWATGMVVLGYAAGNSWRRVESIAKRASLVVLVLVVVAAVVGLAARWVARHPEQIHAARDRLLARPHVARLRVRYRRQLESLARRFHPEGALGLSLTASVLVLVAAGWAFGAVLQDVLAGESLDQVDRPVLRFFVAHREPWATSAARMLTWLGSSAVLIPLLLAVGLGWWWRSGRRQPLGLLAGGYAGSWVLSTAIKDLVGRPRPPHAVALTHASGFAFPSGHATDATVAWLLLASLATAGTPRWSAKVAWWAGAVALSVVVGLTRLYLGVHWLTDVTGGFALGLVWVTILLATIRTFPFMRRQPVRPRRHAPANRS